MTDINVTVTENNPIIQPFGTILGLGTPVDLLQFNVLAGPPAVPQAGDLWWDQADQTLTLHVDGVSLQIGQEFYTKGVNKTGSTIVDGTPISSDGAQGNRPKILVSSNDDFDLIATYIGLSTEDILNNEEGFVTIFGAVRGIDTSAYAEGAPVYLGVNGTLTPIRPSTGSIIVVGIAVNSTSNGTVFVIYPGQVRTDLFNVMTSAIADGDMQPRQVNMWVNESTDKLTFKVKYSGGNIKSGEVSLT